MQAVAPGSDEYLPAGQAAQTNALLTYWPASQLVSSSTTLAADIESSTWYKKVVKIQARIMMVQTRDHQTIIHDDVYKVDIRRKNDVK